MRALHLLNTPRWPTSQGQTRQMPWCSVKLFGVGWDESVVGWARSGITVIQRETLGHRGLGSVSGYTKITDLRRREAYEEMRRLGL